MGNSANRESKFSLKQEKVNFHQKAESESEVQNNEDDNVDFGDHATVTFVFWRDYIACLDRSKQLELGLLLFSTLFKKQPQARPLFIGSDISQQSLRLLDMFGWLLRSLNGNNNLMRAKTLQALGERHRQYGVKIEYFEPMLEALNDCLVELTPQGYTVKVRIALKSLFRNAANVMMSKQKMIANNDNNKNNNNNNNNENNKQNYENRIKNNNNNNNNNNNVLQQIQGVDEQKVPFPEIDSETFKQKYRFLRSIDHCLSDPLGFEYLDAYLKQQLCPELTQFHKAYQIYRSCLNPKLRQEIAIEIIKLFLINGAQYELNDSSDNRNKIRAIIDKCNQNYLPYPIDLFDETHTWIKFQISQNAWIRFKNTVKKQL